MGNKIINKLPPQAIEIEEAVLGAILLESYTLNKVINILKPESFYKDANSRIYSAILKLFNKSEPIDILTITQELKKLKQLDLVGGAYYITTLTNKVAGTDSIEFHARIVQQKFIQRELIRISNEHINISYEDSVDVFDILDRAERDLFSITKETYKKEPSNGLEISRKFLEHQEKLLNRTEDLIGVPSGISSLDKITGGFQNSDLIIIAARPAMGKTALVLSVTRNVAIGYNKPIAIFSLEMSELQLTNRLISNQSELPSYLIQDPKKANDIQLNKIFESAGEISNSPLFIDDTPSLSILELRAKARRLKDKYNIEMIIIDYLQLMTVGNEIKGNREQEISHISRNLKALAKDLNIPIIALSQLSRAVESRGGDKRPMLSDLRESGAIEQDADIVIFIHRPEYYGITEDSQGNSTIGMGELIVAKHRNGATDSVLVRYISKFTKFCNIENEEIKYPKMQQNVNFYDKDEPF